MIETIRKILGVQDPGLTSNRSSFICGDQNP